jgi:hypothetical protein
MNAKRLKLTPELQAPILASIRAGGFPHVAAEAWGVPRATFEQWIEWGTRSKPPARDPYKSFALAVIQAQAQARLKAEMAAMEDDPHFWLKNGPGRDQPNKPGWSAMVRPLLTANTQTINLFTSPDFLQFMAILRAVLAPYPDALAAVTAAMDSKPAPKPVPTLTVTAESK